VGFRFVPQSIPEVLLIEHDRHGDARGFFAETYREQDFAPHHLPRFVQDNHSRSARGVLRGLHYQNPPKPLAKLVQCVRGKIFDVAVDIRRGSPSFGRWVGVELSEDRPQMLLVPVGFAHGFCTLSDTADVFYRQSDYWAPACERSIRWNDPYIGIAWPIAEPILSAKDAAAPLLADADNQLAGENLSYKDVRDRDLNDEGV
jgi:dTDP-4-dehydrorhamnose 3,5-epimerase